MTRHDYLLDAIARISVATAATVYASPFVMIGVWLTGLA
jgi:hypothetical protein